jgi:uncharacterized protein DUF5994
MAQSSVPASAGVRGPPPRTSPASVDLVLAPSSELGPRLRWSWTTGTIVAILVNQVKSSGAVRGPVRLRDAVLDGSWRPDSADLRVELPVLIPVLDHVRGLVTRLLLSAAGWTARPHHILAAGREVSVGYLSGQSPSTLTVLCADGGVFALRVAPPGSPADVPHLTATEPREYAWEGEGGGLGPAAEPGVR